MTQLASIKPQFSAAPAVFNRASSPAEQQLDARRFEGLKAVEALKDANDPKAKRAAARDQLRQEVELARKTLDALRLLGPQAAGSAGRAAKTVLERLDGATTRYASAADANQPRFEEPDAPVDALLGAGDIEGFLIEDARTSGRENASQGAFLREEAELLSSVNGVLGPAQAFIRAAEDDALREDANGAVVSIALNLQNIAKSARAVQSQRQPSFGLDIRL